MEKVTKGLDDFVKLMGKSLELITVAMSRNKARMKKAIELQDKLRRKSKGWNATEALREWRDTRHGTSRA